MHPDHLTAEDLICDESFQRYATARNSDDKQKWESWIEQHPHQLHEVQEALRIISILNGKQGNVQEQMHQLEDGIGRFQQLKLALNREEKSSTRSRIYVSALVAFVLVIAGSSYLIFTRGKPVNEAPLPEAKMIVIRSGNEPRKTIVMPDGSVVTLRRNSSVKTAIDFGTTKRELELSGEAFFDVAHDAARPFIVHTEEADIEVLGTAFNVSAYPGTGQTETALIRGSVSVIRRSRPGDKIMLTPSRKIIVGKSVPNGSDLPEGSSQVVPLATDPVNHKAKETAWVRNRLKIEDEPLSEIARKLQDWYGISMIFKDDEVKKYRYSGTFESESVVKALEALQLSYPFHFRVEKERIIISR